MTCTAGNSHKYGAKSNDPDRSVARHERDRIIRIDGEQHARVIADMQHAGEGENDEPGRHDRAEKARHPRGAAPVASFFGPIIDRKSTRLNSSHLGISYAVFCLKKKKPRSTRVIP